MNKEELKAILEDVRDKRVSPDEAALKLRMKPFEDLGYAKVDLHRGIRQGIPEVIYGAGKTGEEIRGISEILIKNGSGVIITRINDETAETLKDIPNFTYHKRPRLGYIGNTESLSGRGLIIVAQEEPATFRWLKKLPSPPNFSGIK